MNSGLSQAPVFLPVVADYYKGLATSLPIHTRLLNGKPGGRELHEIFTEHYKNQHFVKVMPYIDEEALKDSYVNSLIPSEGCIFDGGIDITACNNTNMANIFVIGNDAKGIAMIVCRIDNLGKGASGAAIQNMNLMLGFDETLNL